MAKTTKRELTWIGKENGPKLEPRVLIEEQRDGLIGKIEEQLRRRQGILPLFVIRWTLT